MKQLVCLCNVISAKELQNSIAKNGLTSVEEIKLATNAGTSCGRCVENIKTFLIENQNKNIQLKINWE
jgi:NAD(P)H-nitrite reductase large subunit